jgi:hypothetical protein
VIFLDCVSYRAHRGKESFGTHAWMLSTLLGSAKFQNSRDAFSLYIIAASFEKILYRMKNARLSIPYHNCLKSLTSFAFPNVKQKSVDKKSFKRDQAFIHAIPAMAKLVLNESTKLEIPNLRRAAASSMPIYDESTYMEFHHLLCKLIKGFEDSLDEVKKLKDSKVCNSDIIYETLKKVYAFGYYLRIMVKSFVIEVHLEAIANLLVVDIQEPSISELEEDTESDYSDFQPLTPYSLRKGQLLLPWQSYRDWLRLIVHYFHAGHVLTKYVHSLELDHLDSNSNITIKILTPPVPKKGMITWIDLLSSERFFPTLPGHPSGKDFIEFFNSACEKDKDNIGKVNEILSSARGLLKVLESNPLDNLDNQIDTLAQQVTNCPSIAVAPLGGHILALKACLQPQDQSAMMRVIVGKLKNLSDRGVFFENLRVGGLHHGGKFLGMYHCEAYIASLLTFCHQFREQSSGLDIEELSEQDPNTIQVKGLLTKIMVSQVFLHCLNPC